MILPRASTHLNPALPGEEKEGYGGKDFQKRKVLYTASVLT